MVARSVVRFAISLFVVVLVAVSALGWVWAGTHLSPGQAIAGRFVLAGGVVAAGAALSLLWRWNPAGGGSPTHRRP